MCIRDRFTSRATLFAGIGSTLASILIPVFSTGKNAIGGSSFTAYGRIALIIAILAPLFLSITIFGVRERRDPPAAKQERFRFREIIQTILRNDQLVWIAVIFLLQQIGNGLIVGGLGSTYIYLTFGYEGGLYSLFTMVGMSATCLLYTSDRRSLFSSSWKSSSRTFCFSLSKRVLFYSTSV